MPAKITFSPDGKWAGGSRIPPSLMDISNLSVWMENFVKEFKEIGKKYLKSMAGDGTLVGQEKINLTAELNDLIAGLFILRRYLTVDNPNHFVSLDNSYNFDFEIRLDHSYWSGKGFISGKYTFKLHKFNDWYNEVLLKKMQQFFALYSAAMADGRLTDTERNKLVVFIETAVFDILVIEKIILSAGIDR
jgi:hypothetical protein